MFGIGYQEMFLILVAALVIFGPSRLPEMAGQIGRWVREFRRMTADLTEEFEKTVAEADDIKRTVTGEITGMRSQVASVTDSVKKDLEGTVGTGKPGASAAKRPGTVAGGKKLGAATERNSSVRKPVGSASRTATAGKVAEAPVASKADPLADVSLLDDEPAMPTNGRPVGAPGSSRPTSTNGVAAANGKDGGKPHVVGDVHDPASSGGAPADGNGADVAALPTDGAADALARARRRRAAAGYARRG